MLKYSQEPQPLELAVFLVKKGWDDQHSAFLEVQKNPCSVAVISDKEKHFCVQ